MSLKDNAGQRLERFSPEVEQIVPGRHGQEKTGACAVGMLESGMALAYRKNAGPSVGWDDQTYGFKTPRAIRRVGRGDHRCGRGVDLGRETGMGAYHCVAGTEPRLRGADQE